MRIIDDKHLIVLLSNTESRISLDGPANDIFNILYNKPFILPKKHIADTLDKIILEKGIISAINCYQELKSTHPDEYDFSKEELEWLGKGLQERGMLNEAIDIYRLIIELSPNWWQAYRDAADIYVQKGDKELSMKFYAKSLEMNPEPWYAKEISEILKTLTKQDN
jgi:tetratricopeptide (TPR) repeat protein